MPDETPFPTLDLASISAACGPWEVDEERARRDAEHVLASIDFSRRDIVIWAPGTSARDVNPAFRTALRAAERASTDDMRASLTGLIYEASWHIRRSVPTGMATLKLVLLGIRARTESSSTAHDVYLAGESQGAWIIGELMADPDVGEIPTRAVLMGHPYVAGHEYDQGEDPRVIVINNAGDQVTLDFKGDPSHGLDAMIAIRTLQLTRNMPRTVRALVANLDHVGLMLKGISYEVPRIRACLRNPHDYADDMPRAIDYLFTGELAAAPERPKVDAIAVAHELAPKLAPKVMPHVTKIISRTRRGAA